MGCRHTRARIVAWLDQELAESEVTRVEQHLQDCASCQSHASLLRTTQPRPESSPDDLDGEPYFEEMLSGILHHYDSLDAEGVAFHRQRWWPTEVRVSAAQAVAYAAVLATALCWAWSSHLEAQEAVARSDLLFQSVDQERFTEGKAEFGRSYKLPVLQTTPLWTTTGTTTGTLKRPSLTTPATTPKFRTVSTTPYRGTF